MDHRDRVLRLAPEDMSYIDIVSIEEMIHFIYHHW